MIGRTDTQDNEGVFSIMLNITTITDKRGRVLISDPPIAQLLFQSTVASWFWLVVRVFVGWQFLEAGRHKLNTPAWVDGSGQGILGFWKGALATTPAGQPVITYDWYRTFIQFLVDSNAAGWFSYAIVGGEIAVGVGLILGAFAGIAAFGGLLMNMAFLLAGTVSVNPVLALLGMLLILAWKNAGYVGLDRFLLPLAGTPWQRNAEPQPTSSLRVAPVGR
jgi:thiosulfate dehydrogenase [quinone] large subunit